MLYNHTTLDLRPFSAQDTASIITWPLSAEEARQWAGPQTRWPIGPDDIDRWHVDADVHPYILSSGATPLGYGELWVDPAEEEVELARLIVAPEHRGQGLGVALVRLLLEESWRTPYPRAFLRVVPDNQAAIGCYHKAGFTPVSPAEQHSFNQGQPLAYLWMSCISAQE